MNEKFLAGQQAGREWRETASPDELKKILLAVESMGKRGVAEAARQQTGQFSPYDIKYNLGFATGALVDESETTVA